MAEYLDNNRRGAADLTVGRWGADYPDADTFVYGVLHSAAGSMGRYFARPDIDQLAEQARAETDPRVRHSLYRKVEDLSPGTPCCCPSSTTRSTPSRGPRSKGSPPSAVEPDDLLRGPLDPTLGMFA